MNDSTEIPQNLCNLAYALNRDPWINSLVVLQVVFNLLNLCNLWLISRLPSIRKVAGLVKTDLKVIVIAGLSYYLIGVLTPLFIYVYKLIMVVFNRSSCEYVWSNESCFWIISQFVFVPTYVYLIFHVSLLLERLYATFLPQHSKRDGIFGFITVTLMIVGPNLGLYGVYTTLKDSELRGYRAYCSSLTPVDTPLQKLFLILVALELTISLGDWLLLLYNRRQLLRFKQQISDVKYTLDRSFRLREIKISIRLIFPFSLFHTVAYCGLNILMALLMYDPNATFVESALFWKELVHFARTLSIWFVAVCFLLHEWLWKKDDAMEWLTIGKRKEDATDVYFRDFQKMIS